MHFEKGILSPHQNGSITKLKYMKILREVKTDSEKVRGTQQYKLWWVKSHWKEYK